MVVVVRVVKMVVVLLVIASSFLFCSISLIKSLLDSPYDSLLPQAREEQMEVNIVRTNIAEG